MPKDGNSRTCLATYDWDRLDFLLKKSTQVRPMVREDLDAFLKFLARLRSAKADT